MEFKPYLLNWIYNNAKKGAKPPKLQEKNIEITENGTTNVSPDSGYDGLSGVEIDVDVDTDVSDYFGTSFAAGSTASTYRGISGVSKTIKKVPLMPVPNDMSYMFAYCQRLAIIPLLDTSNVTNMTSAFENCNSLTTIPLLNTSNVTNMEKTFNECYFLTTIPLLNTSKVSNMLNMFNNCQRLTTIPQLDTASATNMQGMFQGCTALTTIPQLNTSNVTSMVYMFYNCSNLVTISQLTTTKVNNFQQFCYGCTKLENVPVLSAYGITNNTRMQNMFQNCSSLTDESLNNIMATCITARITSNKTLKYIGLTSAQATRCQSLSNWDAFVNAGWSSGY